VRLAGELPLEPRRETGAAAAAQPGGLHLVDHRGGRHLRQHLGERGIAVPRDRVADALGVDPAAVAQHDLRLPLEEVEVLPARRRGLARGVLQHQALHLAAAADVRRHDLGGVLGLHALVEGPVLAHEHHGAHDAGAHAAGLDERDPLAQPLPVERLPQRVAHLFGSRRETAAAEAHEDLADLSLFRDGLFLTQPLAQRGELGDAAQFRPCGGVHACSFSPAAAPARIWLTISPTRAGLTRW
jgi:hypothetical protein